MVANLSDCFRRCSRRRRRLYSRDLYLRRDKRSPHGAQIPRLEKAGRAQIVNRITARYPNGAAYIRICPTLEEELNRRSPLADIIIAETLNTLADLEDEEERRGGYCTFCADFTREGTEPRVKRNGLAYSCKYCPICGRKLI